MAQRVRSEGLVFLFDASLEDGVLIKEGPEKGRMQNTVVPDFFELVAQAFEYVADDMEIPNDNYDRV